MVSGLSVDFWLLNDCTTENSYAQEEIMAATAAFFIACRKVKACHYAKLKAIGNGDITDWHSTRQRCAPLIRMGVCILK